MSTPRRIQLGLCCVNTTLRNQKPPIFTSRKMIVRSIEVKGIDLLKELILQNLRDLITMIEWNEKNGIRVLRVSSELFPHKSNGKVENYDYEFAIPLLTEIGNLAKKYGHRLTFHPGQYNVIGTPTMKVFQQTCADLQYHAEVLDLMGMPPESVLVVHGGGLYQNKEETINRWCEQFHMLPDIVKRRLVIENCEKCYSIEDCLEISNRLNIPVVFDTHHFECYNQLHPDVQLKNAEEYMPLILETWNRRNIKPKFHISEQGPGKIGHHSDYIETIPEYLLDIPKKHNIHIDIMIEAKMKEQAILRLYEKYPLLNCKKKKYKFKVGNKNSI